MNLMNKAQSKVQKFSVISSSIDQNMLLIFGPMWTEYCNNNL